ncbi:MAG: hypothetical protein R2941_01150 [Desulfobacterales bacterium]
MWEAVYEEDAAVPIHFCFHSGKCQRRKSFLANRKYKKLCLTTKPSAIIAAEELDLRVSSDY